jgi:hypothetical protein
MLKIYVYGYINQIQSNRHLERETARNVEMMWLTGRLAPDFKTIADFRKDNGPAKQAQAATACAHAGTQSGHARISNAKAAKGYGRWLTHLSLVEPEALSPFTDAE